MCAAVCVRECAIITIVDSCWVVTMLHILSNLFIAPYILRDRARKILRRPGTFSVRGPFMSHSVELPDCCWSPKGHTNAIFALHKNTVARRFCTIIIIGVVALVRVQCVAECDIRTYHSQWVLLWNASFQRLRSHSTLNDIN